MNGVKKKFSGEKSFFTARKKFFFHRKKIFHRYQQNAVEMLKGCLFVQTKQFWGTSYNLLKWFGTGIFHFDEKNWIEYGNVEIRKFEEFAMVPSLVSTSVLCCKSLNTILIQLVVH